MCTSAAVANNHWCPNVLHGIAAAGVMVLDRGDCSRVVYKCLSCMGTDHYEMVRIQCSLCSLH